MLLEPLFPSSSNFPDPPPLPTAATHSPQPSFPPTRPSTNTVLSHPGPSGPQPFSSSAHTDVSQPALSQMPPPSVHHLPSATLPHHPSQPPPPYPQSQQQQRPPFTLSPHDTAVLAQNYSDFLAILRNNHFLCDWIFQWVLTAYPSHSDASRLDLSLARGFKSIQLCGNRGCASTDAKTSLQNTSTILLPVQRKDSAVVGYFIEATSDQSAKNMVRTGKYIFCSSRKELFKISKVRGPPAANAFISVCISRTCVLASDMFIKDYAMVSFSWQESTGRVPAQCMVHSRTLSFHKLFQTVQQAGLGRHYDEGVSNFHTSTDPSNDINLSDSCFYALGAFGVYESVVIPSKLAVGMCADGNEPPSLAVGNWALSDHIPLCNGPQLLHLGIMSNENTDLRAQFAQMYSHVSNPLGTQNASGSGSASNLEDVNLVMADRVGTHVPTAQAREQGAATSTAMRRADLSSFSRQGVQFGRKGSGSNYEYVREPTSQSVPPRTSTSAAATGFNTSTQHLETNVLVDEAQHHREITAESVGLSSGLPTDIANSLMIPVQPQLAVTNGQATFHTGAEVSLEAVESIEAAVASHATSAADNRRSVAANASTFTPPLVSFAASTALQEARSGSRLGLEGATSNHTFKKTLPAPTKSEIVIRNRISAQRSNEKRRRKIEATKSELAYLKNTYLPQLEHKQGSLISENQTLRLRFMEKYHEQAIDSFF